MYTLKNLYFINCIPLKFRLFIFSHPKYRAVLMKKFPNLSCAPPPDDTVSAASGVTTVTEEKPAA